MYPQLVILLASLQLLQLHRVAADSYLLGGSDPVCWPAPALLEAGADPNAASFFGLGLLLSVMPLHNSASGGHTATVAALLKAGADPNAPWP